MCMTFRIFSFPEAWSQLLSASKPATNERESESHTLGIAVPFLYSSSFLFTPWPWYTVVLQSTVRPHHTAQEVRCAPICHSSVSSHRTGIRRLPLICSSLPWLAGFFVNTGQFPSMVCCFFRFLLLTFLWTWEPCPSPVTWSVSHFYFIWLSPVDSSAHLLLLGTW